MKKTAITVLCAVSLLMTFVIAGPVFAAAPAPVGNASSIPALYDGQQMTIHFVEFPPTAEAKLLANNKSLNIIYQSDQAVAAGFNFISVINAIPGPGFNPLWQEVQIVFKPGTAFTQYPSDDAILAAAKAGKITLVPTTEVYQCPVVGR